MQFLSPRNAVFWDAIQEMVAFSISYFHFWEETAFVYCAKEQKLFSLNGFRIKEGCCRAWVNCAIGTVTCISLVFKTQRTNLSGSAWNQGIGLEIPAIYTFHHKKPSKGKKLSELIRHKEDRAEVNWCRNTRVLMSMTYNNPLTEMLLSLYYKDYRTCRLLLTCVDIAICYIEVDFMFGLSDYVRHIEEFVISRFIISWFYSIHLL